MDGDICAEGDAICYAESTSEDQSAMISCTSDNMAGESVAATDAATRSNDDDYLLRSSSYEDIYVGTKLPGDEYQDDDDGVLDVSDIGDRFDSRPASMPFRRQSAGRSSSFENLYEIQKKEAGFGGERHEMETDGDHFCTNQWQTKDSSEDVSEKDSLTPFSSLIGQARRNSPIDITVESGLDRVGQTTEQNRSSTKRFSTRFLQHSMSYDMVPDSRHHKLGSGSSSLDGDADDDDDGVDFQTGRNTTSGTGMVVVAQCDLSVAAFGVVLCESTANASCAMHREPLYF